MYYKQNFKVDFKKWNKNSRVLKTENMSELILQLMFLMHCILPNWNSIYILSVILILIPQVIFS